MSLPDIILLIDSSLLSSKEAAFPITLNDEYRIKYIDYSIYPRINSFTHSLSLAVKIIAFHWIGHRLKEGHEEIEIDP